MGGGFSSKSQQGSRRQDAKGESGLNRVQYIEHRRRSSIIDMDVEKLMSQPGDQGHISSTYRPTMRNGELKKGASAAAGKYEGSAQSERPLRFSTGVEVFTRPMTLQKDKQTLHYTRQELFKMQQEAEEEDEAFSIVGVKVENNAIVYGIRWLDEDDGTIEWIRRQAVYEAGPTMLCEYESIHIDELMLMNTKLADVLESQRTAKEQAAAAEALKLKQEREKALEAAKDKAQAELRDLESSDAPKSEEDAGAAVS